MLTTLIASTLVSFAAAASAQDSFIRLTDDNDALRPLSGAIVVAVEDGCPKGAMCFVASTNVTLEIPVSGCFSKITPVSYAAFAGSDGQVVLQYSGYEILDKRSMAAFCEPPKALVTLHIMGSISAENIVLVNLQSATATSRAAQN